MSKIRVVLADDHAVLLRVLNVILSKDEEIELVGEARDGLELLAFCEENTIDVAVVDIRMPNLNGIDASKIIKEKYPDVRILILTTFDNDEYINQFLEANIDGYLLKGSEELLLCQAVKSVYQGINTLDKVVVRKISEELKRIAKIKDEAKEASVLTTVERKVAELVVEGYYNKDIANALDISYGRTRNIVSAVYRKMGVSRRAELIKLRQ